MVDVTEFGKVRDPVTGKDVTINIVPPGGIEDDGKGIICDSPEKAVEIMRETADWPQNLKDFADENPAIKEILLDPTLSRHQRKLQLLPFVRRLRTEGAEKLKAALATEKQIDFLERLASTEAEYDTWKRLAPKLEKNDCSRLHQLTAFLKAQHRIVPQTNKGEDPNKYPWKELSVFVVQHDWAAAFRNAGDYADGGFNLPYDICAFEFRINGRSVTVLSRQPEEQPINYVFYVGFGDMWITPEDEFDSLPAFIFAKEQIKAICVALDAEVATRQMTRVSEKINAKREQEGREPFFSYHVVSLNRRFRASNPSSGGSGTQGKKRLHFRRGHWRHFAEFKTWVRWCLVGNPELGFIDKEYRL